MSKFKIIMVFVFFSVSSIAISQTNSKQKTDVNKDIDLVKVYESYVKDGYGTSSIYNKLANAYYFKNEFIEAKKWFEKLFEIEKLEDATLKFRYKQTLKALNLNPEENTHLTIAGTN
ncbi:MAG: tetratricopeptide repeat protein [Flavobacteriaceae bacterium]|nr:tetratricopeptide repeat protein [Flavobacteriaceae bacterium]